jgi:hypothetical protein
VPLVLLLGEPLLKEGACKPGALLWRPEVWQVDHLGKLRHVATELYHRHRRLVNDSVIQCAFSLAKTVQEETSL